VSVVPYHPVWELQWIRVLQQAIAESRCVRISYGKSGATEPVWYHVKPYAVTESFGLLYLDGFVRQGTGDEHRLFRIDRVFSVQLTDERFVPDPGYDPHTRFDERGRLRVPEDAQQLVVRYTGQAARLVAEREGVTVTSKGTLVWSYPLLDRSWAVRTVLQHGTEAEALSPPEIREYIVTVLDRALAETDI
jgi:predicted DNA-binding transcriptional regulator YafY